MKKIIVAFLVALFAPLFVFAQPTSGTGFVPLAPIPGLTQGVTADTAGLANFLNNLYIFLIGIAAVIVVIQLIRGGLMIATQDSISKHGEGRAIIQQALFGLVLILAPALVFTIINPSILNLSYSLDPIVTHPYAAPPTQQNNTGNNTVSDITDSTYIICQNGSCTTARSSCSAQTPEGYSAYMQDKCSDSSGNLTAPTTSFWGLGSESCPIGRNLVVKCYYAALTYQPE